MPGRLVLLDCSPRVAPGCLTADAWDVLRSASVVFTGAPDHPQTAALTQAGVVVELRDEPDAVRLADTLLAASRDAVVVWLLAPDGERALGTAIASRLVAGAPASAGAVSTRGGAPAAEVDHLDGGAPTAQVEHLLGSYDLPGSHMLDLVAVMDRLRSPGGCPWDAEQTHESLSRYLIEEAHEVAEAIDTGDPDHLVEELGDVLLQVVFHARVAAESPERPFTVDEVADGIVAKLVRRHPHVFADVNVTGAANVEANWEQIKAAEKGRTSVLDGIPPSLPALSYAEKVLVRAERTGLALGERGQAGDRSGAPAVDVESAEALGAALLDLVAAAHRAGFDPEAALRRTARELVDRAEADAGTR